MQSTLFIVSHSNLARIILVVYNYPWHCTDNLKRERAREIEHEGHISKVIYKSGLLKSS